MMTIFEALKKAAEDFESDNPMAYITLKMRELFTDELTKRPTHDPEVVYAKAYQFFMEKHAGVR